jgi:hypothetical protein
MTDLPEQKRDGFSSNRHPALAYCWSMMFSENRYPLFGIMLWHAPAGHNDCLPGIGLLIGCFLERPGGAAPVR